MSRTADRRLAGRLARLTLVTVAGAASVTIASCSSPGNPCAAAQAHVEACIADYCDADHADELVCRAAASATAAGSTSTCDGDRLDDAERVVQTSCGDLLAEAGAAAGGKADAPCPWYFQWCEQLTPESGAWDVHLLAADGESLTLQVDLVGLDRAPVTIDGQVYESLSVMGAGSTGDVGLPDLPEIGLLVGVPWDATQVVVESAVSAQTEVLEGVVPTPFRPLARDDEAPVAYRIDPAAYADYGQYPAALAQTEAPSVWRDYRVTRVAVRPVVAVTGTRQVIVSRSTVVTLRFAGGSGTDGPVVPGTGQPMDEAYATGIVNFETASPRAATDGEPLDTLAIVDDPLLETVTPLLDAKRAAGKTVRTILTSEIAAGAAITPELVKAKLAEVYAAERPLYVLLVGNTTAIPPYVYGQGGWEQTPSDAWYSFLEGDDLLADVAIGRLIGSTPDELKVLVDKTLAYQNGDPQAEWRRKLVVAAHSQEYPGKYTECVKSILTGDWGRAIDWLPLIGGEGATNEQLTAAINDGAGIVSYRGHGDTGYWCDWGGGNQGNYVAKDQDLHNGDKTPVVLSIACLTGGIDKPGSLAEQFTLRAGGGAVAFLGATQPSYTVPNHDFNRYLFQALLWRNEHHIGILSNLANAMLLKQYGKNVSATDNVQMYLWIGDPSLEVGHGYDCSPLAVADAGADVETMAGTGVALGTPAVEGTTYSWSPADGLSCTDCAQPVATPATTTTYTLTAQTSCSRREDTITVTVKPLPPPAVPWCNTQWPYSATTTVGVATELLHAHVYVDGLTPSGGTAPALRVELGFGPQDLPPSDPAWQWTPAVYNTTCTTCATNEEWKASLTPTTAGAYFFAARVANGEGAEWVYCDRSDHGRVGSADGWQAENAPSFIVN